MKILADECVPDEVVAKLLSDGHDVESASVVMATAKDQDVLAFSVSTSRLLLTADKDFGELVFRDGQPHLGIVLMRFNGLPMTDRASLVSELFHVRETELIGAFTVIDATSVRIR